MRHHWPLVAVLAAPGCATTVAAAPGPSAGEDPRPAAVEEAAMEPALVEVVQIRHRPSAELEKLLTQVAIPNGRSAPRMRVVSDARTNTLLLHGGEADIARLRGLVETLDRE